MGDQYCLLGPYKEYSAKTEVEEGPLGTQALDDAVNAVRMKGFKVFPNEKNSHSISKRITKSFDIISL